MNCFHEQVLSTDGPLCSDESSISWYAVSNPDLVRGIPEDRLDPSRVVSILGLKLDLDTSEFMFNMDEKFSQFNVIHIITCREIVAIASMIFNTQGFVSPCIMQYKKFLLLLWHNEEQSGVGELLLVRN